MKNILTFEEFLNESAINEMVKSFIYSKKEVEFPGDVKEIKKEAGEFLAYLQKERYTASQTNFMYYPNFVWAGGKQVFGPSIGILVGSDTIMIRPIGRDKPLKVSDGLLYRLIHDGRIESYTMNFPIVKESINEAASVPSNVMEFAKRKGSYATALVKKAATWAEKAGKRISGGTAIGKNYSTIILDIRHQGAEIYINLDNETIELFGEEVTDAKSFLKVFNAEANESTNENAKTKVEDYTEGSFIHFKNGEVWIVVKPGLRASNSRKKSDEVAAKPYNKIAKDRNVSLSVDLSLDYLNANITKIVNEEVNEASQTKFIVGKKYKHDKFGEFVVIELMSGQNTKVQFKKNPKGETSIIAGWGSDGYPEVK
jgi:hypothetical protein